jgi:hypothetical protein
MLFTWVGAGAASKLLPGAGGRIKMMRLHNTAYKVIQYVDPSVNVILFNSYLLLTLILECK